MGYTLSLPLKDDTDKEKILDILEDFSSKTITLHVSTDKKEHGYAVDIYNGIFFSFSILEEFDFQFLINFIKKIANKFGLTKKMNEKEYPYFFYDDEITYIIKSEDLNYFQDKDIPYSLIEEKEFKFIENKNLFFKIILKNKIKSFKKEISNINSKVEEL